MLIRALFFALFLFAKPLLTLAAPVAVADAASTSGKTAVTFSVTANDTGGADPATVDFNTSPATTPRLTTRTVSGQGTYVADAAGNVTFTPLDTFSGTSTTMYFVRDGAGAASGRVSITVRVGPAANTDVVLVTYQTSRTFQPTANDVSGAGYDYLTLDLDLTQPGVQAQRVLAAGTLQSDGAGNVTFAPTAGYAGSVPDVTYTINDTRVPALGSNAGTIQLRVGGVPFACSGEFYQLSQVASTAQLYRLVRNNTGGTVNYTSSLLYDTGTQLNALALSGQDGYLYAIGIGAANAGQLYQLSQASAVNLGAVPGLPLQGFNSATADNQGNLYLANNSTSTIYRVDLKSFSATGIALASAANCGDIAFDPSTGYLYTSRYTNNLYRVDLASTATPKPVLALSTATATGADMGSIFFDASGTLYGATNQGDFVLYDLGTGLTTRVGSANTASQGDGASCAFPAQKLDVVKQLGTLVRRGPTVYDAPFTIRVRNSSSAEAPNVQVNEFLASATATTNVTFAGASSVAVLSGPVAGGSLPAASANPNFTGRGPNTGLLLGTQSLQAGQVGTLTFTVRVTYPPDAMPASAQNTAHASTAGASPNAGFQQLADGSLVSPDQVLAADRSTDGSTLPATANGDTPTPTPITYAQALPVVLSAFGAAPTAGGTAVQLTWATASEVDNAYFGVERSADGVAFVEVGTVAGAGTSGLGHAYAWLDATPLRTGRPGYYRLRQVDHSGATSYSPTRTVQLGGAPAPAAIGLYPNPATQGTTLDLTALPAGAYPVVFYDLAGRQLASLVLVGGTTHALDLGALPLGTSVVRVAGQALRLVRTE